MPKQKSHSGLKKRVKVTATGKLKRAHAFTNHNADSQTTKQNRQLRGTTLVDPSDQKRIKRLVPGAK